MNQQLSQKPEVEEITFAALTTFIKAELQNNPDSNCKNIAEKYGISETTMNKLINKLKSEESSQ